MYVSMYVCNFSDIALYCVCMVTTRPNMAASRPNEP